MQNDGLGSVGGKPSIQPGAEHTHAMPNAKAVPNKPGNPATSDILHGNRIRGSRQHSGSVARNTMKQPTTSKLSVWIQKRTLTKAREAVVKAENNLNTAKLKLFTLDTETKLARDKVDLASAASEEKRKPLQASIQKAELYLALVDTKIALDAETSHKKQGKLKDVARSQIAQLEKLETQGDPLSHEVLEHISVLKDDLGSGPVTTNPTWMAKASAKIKAAGSRIARTTSLKERVNATAGSSEGRFKEINVAQTALNHAKEIARDAHFSYLIKGPAIHDETTQEALSNIARTNELIRDLENKNKVSVKALTINLISQYKEKLANVTSDDVQLQAHFAYTQAKAELALAPAEQKASLQAAVNAKAQALDDIMN